MAESGVIDLQAWRKRLVQRDEASQPSSPQEPSLPAQGTSGELSAASFALPMAFFAFWPAFVPAEATQWPRRPGAGD
ncbi:hypothetical protein JQ557_07015 [Bradyrhizobium sp. U87765 SZCCT0131]|uniref:hypothetical protein n=1 Tax=unclassified Bradyrhizobium TaxID=2631580 RepID=UPI001BAAD4D5|nr:MULTISPECIES: hypothetical protein [unclassified Bradyrhizobium]MBR1217732.1 hypothetical protein [Bradyrhizobium sp. U87765 SZCCT0131]MBR1261322.1 hypothetical protein [Bradyrhizobium sp. U87765 SZCCT0134]MBR1303230.1 hypothetical protein [Bradyrhizobium sp. U87765 SZCCT0110]MBR1318836.1 hypothetical protein [Bradyrhizobium sp. U87765 SZCCT0109]MBR1347161.1 hypothetical protein [Bradyrhizobium sp. U87765 SZCCT0048]